MKTPNQMKPTAPCRDNVNEIVTNPPVAYLFLVRRREDPDSPSEFTLPEANPIGYTTDHGSHT